VKWSMYIDDERTPKTTDREWVIVRSVDEAIRMILDRGFPSYISFDHDLGERVRTGHDFAKWIVESDLSGLIQIPNDFKYNVHSANPVGAKNIIGTLDGYLEFKNAT
jgi:hypothetical protein